MLLEYSHGIYYLMEQGQLKCFIEEVPKDTLVLVRFKGQETKDGEVQPGVQFQGTPMNNDNQQQVPSGQTGLKVTVTDPEGVQSLQRVLGLEGRFAFTSQLGGEHKICLTLNTPAGWFSEKMKLKLHLDIETGESATDYEDLAKSEHLSALEVEVRRLNDRIKDIRSEQNYQRAREMDFRDTSEETNTRVVWWSIIQTLILVGAGMWQISHLKKFFKTKKLV